MSPLKRILICGGLILAACTDSSVSSMGSEQYDMAVAPAPAPRMMKSAEADNVGASDTTPVTSNYLAYRYGYDFSLPATAVKATAQRHADLCLGAGPSLCQILSQSTQDYEADNVSAAITLRAEPTWLEGFSEIMAGSVEDADGKLTSSRVSAEDLTRQILDVDARLSAQTTLRDRLQGLLETRNAELSDLLALERELARVQGEIESATSRLAALRQRVSMSVVDIGYQTRRRAVSSSAFAPIGGALKQFVSTLSEGLAAVINFLALLLPWLLFVILPGIWALLWFIRRARAKRAKS